jgi:pyridoxine 5-phosphate synthase
MGGPRLSVNVDHVATLRQARRAAYPDPVEAARAAEAAGAAGITVHLRLDRRHIQDYDLDRLREQAAGKLNVEMSMTGEMQAEALRVKPHQVTLVPERPEELTTEGGLDLVRHGERVFEMSARLAGAGIAVSVFIDPDPRQIEALGHFAGRLAGFELNTDAYTRADQAAVAGEMAKLSAAGEAGRAQGFHLYAGHGLTTANVGPVASLPGMEELNIGHFLVSRAVIVGMEAAVREMLAAMRAGAEAAQPGQLAARGRL